MYKLCIAAFLAAFASASQAQQLALLVPPTPPQIAGSVLFAVGDAQAVNGQGVARRLTQGAVVREGDTVVTGADSHLQLRMADDALLALRPDSRLRLHMYSFVERGALGSHASMELLAGGLRSITGAIGRLEKQNYLLRGGKALIGVRGTDHETFVVGGETYNRVTIGGTYLASDQGRVDLDPAETGFAAVTEPPRRLERAPAFMHLAFEQSAAGLSPELRAGGLGDERRLRGGLKLGHDHEHGTPDQATAPLLPPRALGENSHKGFGKGGRCDGPCTGPKSK
jgi:hypothetical protein